MNTVQLECFLAVADNLSFARAAEQLHITQPAVTHQISSLENELNVKLFRRTTRTVELTHDGWTFFGYARTILKTTNQAKARLSGQYEDRTQSFSIGCHNPFELNLLPQVLKSLCREFPYLHPELKMVPSQALRNLLQEESIDVMLGFYDEKETKTSNVYVELGKKGIVCAASKEHPLAGKSSVTMKDLEKGTLAVCDPERIPSVIGRLQGQLLGSRASFETFFGDNLECTMAFVRSGISFCLLPDFPFMRQEGLVYIPVETELTISFGLYYKTSNNHAILASFIKIMQSWF
ncbi:MAG: LysR family transcriptional regulator [Blautia sp.]